MRLAAKLIVPLIVLAGSAWRAPAETGGVLAVSSVVLRGVDTKFGASRTVTVTATFDPSPLAGFDVKRGLVAMTVADAPAVRVGKGTKGFKPLPGGRAKFKAKQTAAGPQITKFTVWPARGTITFVVSGGAVGTSPLRQDPAPFALSFGTVEYFGSLVFSAEPPSGTPIAFTRTDVHPETQICSPHEAIVSDDAQWTTLWSIHSAEARPKPVVDFTRNVVAAVFLGNRVNRRYAALVTKVEERASDVLVTYTEYRPTDACEHTPEPVCIYAFATIPRQVKPISFSHAVDVICE